MAKIPNGILGGIQGQVGTVTGYNRYGIDVIRSAKNRGTVKPRAKRLVQRSEITVCNSFAKAFAGKGFFTKTFPAFGHTGPGYNRAVSALMSLALAPSEDGVAISYPFVLISKGNLPPALNAAASATDAGNIQFTWSDNTGTGTSKKTDKAILAAYFPATNEVVYSFDAGTRQSGNAVLETINRQEQLAETWIGYLSDYEDDAGCSVYTGVWYCKVGLCGLHRLIPRSQRFKFFNNKNNSLRGPELSKTDFSFFVDIHFIIRFF